MPKLDEKRKRKAEEAEAAAKKPRIELPVSFTTFYRWVFQLFTGEFYYFLQVSFTTFYRRVLQLFYCKLLNGYFGKQWRPRWNDAQCGISSGSALLAKDKINLQGLIHVYILIWKVYSVPPWYRLWPILFSLFQTRWKNLLVYKGFNICIHW